MTGFAHILVALDDDEAAERVLQAASLFGERCGARITLFHGVDPEELGWLDQSLFVPCNASDGTGHFLV
jgi:nucleotide-binding universal stress UspA family protein